MNNSGNPPSHRTERSLLMPQMHPLPDDAEIAASVEEKLREWLMPGIPKGAISLVAGRPKPGKALFTAWLAAQVTRAGGNVIFSNYEDDRGEDSRPRLRVAGANLDRVTFWNPDLLSPDGLAMLERYIVATDTVLITIDPLRAHLGKAVDDRAALAPLTRLCHRTGVALVAVDHTRRHPRASGSLTDAMLGTGSGFMANARALFVFGKNADDPDQRLLIGAGANHSDDEGRGMICEFDLAPTEINGEEAEVARPLLVDPA